MNTLTLVALTFIAAIAIISLLVGFGVHKTSSTTGVRDFIRAIGPILTAIAKAFTDLD